MPEQPIGSAHCPSRVYWWDGEYEGECGLPEGHNGPHYDGLSWWNDDGESVDEPEAQSQDTRGDG